MSMKLAGHTEGWWWENYGKSVVAQRQYHKKAFELVAYWNEDKSMTIEEAFSLILEALKNV